MFGRDCLKVLGLICFVLPFTGCTNSQVSTIQISPSAQSLAVGQTVQLTATGTIEHGSHPASSQDVTDEVSWSSSAPTVATVNSSGLVSAAAAGSAIISASMAGATGGHCGNYRHIRIRGHRGGIPGFAVHHSRLAIGCIAGWNQPIHRHWNNLVGGYRGYYRPGRLEFERRTDCHHQQ